MDFFLIPKMVSLLSVLFDLKPRQISFMKKEPAFRRVILPRDFTLILS